MTLLLRENSKTNKQTNKKNKKQKNNKTFITSKAFLLNKF